MSASSSITFIPGVSESGVSGWSGARRGGRHRGNVCGERTSFPWKRWILHAHQCRKRRCCRRWLFRRSTIALTLQHRPYSPTHTHTRDTRQGAPLHTTSHCIHPHRVSHPPCSNTPLASSPPQQCHTVTPTRPRAWCARAPAVCVCACVCAKWLSGHCTVMARQKKLMWVHNR